MDESPMNERASERAPEWFAPAVREALRGYTDSLAASIRAAGCPKTLDDEQIRQIVREEIQRAYRAGRYAGLRAGLTGSSY